MRINHQQIKFSATLGQTERIITYAVGMGVGIGVPLLLAVIFYFVFNILAFLLIPIPFLISILIAYLYSPKGYFVADDKIYIHRKIGDTTGLPIDKIQSIIYPAPLPSGFTVGIVYVNGIFGSFGILWNKSWGTYYMYVTDSKNKVELITDDGTHIILSPDEPKRFISEINNKKT